MHEEGARGSFALLETQFLLLGHSHLPLIFGEAKIDDDHPTTINPSMRLSHGAIINLPNEVRLIVNPGSVGQPRDSDPRASYAILDHEARTLTHLRVEYDIDSVQQDMTAAGLPALLVQRLPYGL